MIEQVEPGVLPRGKKAVIALTSWEKRIDTVGLTIFNLIGMCGPEFHIVLTLAEEEFPGKERDLPRDLVELYNSTQVEIIFVRQNYKALKKWIFASRKYIDVPVISADDDCLYTCNYADELYTRWNSNRNIDYIKYYETKLEFMPDGPCTLYKPGLGLYIPVEILPIDFYTNDDAYYESFFKLHHMTGMSISRNKPFIFHTKQYALNPEQYHD